MKRALLLLVGVVVLGAMGYVAFRNTGTVELYVPANEPWKLPLGWLLVLTFLGGVLSAGLIAVFAQAARSVSQWSVRRRERTSERVSDWIHTGAKLLWDGDLERGRATLSKAWRRQPDNGPAALALAASYNESGEIDAARRVLEDAVAHDSFAPELRQALGETVARTGDRSEAIRILETVRVQHPRALRVLDPLRNLYAACGRWEEAARVQEAYLGSLPGGRVNDAERDRLAQYRYRAALANPDLEQRIRSLTMLVDFQRHCLPAVVTLGDALAEAGRTQEAIRVWERALRDRPATVLVERLLAHQPTGRERLQVLGLLRKLRNVDGDHVHALAARAALQTAQIEVAVRELESITQQDTPSIHRLWAELHRQRGETEQALRSLTRVLDGSQPSNGYNCRRCGARTEQWVGHCDPCGSWNSYRSVFELSA